MSNQQLKNLFENGNVEEVKSFFEDNATFDVNMNLDDNQNTPLHCACIADNFKVVEKLLALPQINVNKKNRFKNTPFSTGCFLGKVEAVKILLKDPRVDVNLTDDNNRTALWWSSYRECLEVIKWMIVSGREFNFDTKGEFDDRKYTALAIAKKKKITDVVLLLEQFMKDPEKTRQDLRTELDVARSNAAEVFATVVFLCDDFLRLKVTGEQEPDSKQRARRFFAAVVRFPMEIQMKVSNIKEGINNDLIPHEKRESAFKKVASDME